MGGRTKIRANHDWPIPFLIPSVKRDVSDAGEERIGHFGQYRSLHSSMVRLLRPLFRARARDPSAYLQYWRTSIGATIELFE